ncbi:DUF6907 domain-containing protein [Streptomyces niveus]|uniref:DUF6907 domain-containing protein n=1 Tax=Streptomyces niveus TaxID=193462 RepID=UPI00084C9C7D|nr:hypothetical protein [Streptomyces niveus]
MKNTVQKQVKASTAPAVEPAPKPAPAADRHLTYPLIGGGFLSAVCPSWCTSDHESELQGMQPSDLCHEGDEISLSFTTQDGETDTILAARIQQYPFSTDDGSDKPHMALMADAGSGEILGYQTVSQVMQTIRATRNHLVELQGLAERLADATVEEHAAYHRSLDEQGNGAGNRWLSLTNDEIRTMPIPYLLDVFAAGVIECDTDEVPIEGEVDSIHRDDIVIRLPRILPQLMRERAVRNLLAAHAARYRATSAR